MLLCFIFLSAGAALNPPIRLAIIAEESTAGTANDLLTAELSKKRNIQLLERAEIDRVYREQGLSAANRDYLKLGQVLGADGLLILSALKEGTNQFLQTRLVAVKPGVVIGATRVPWPSADTSEAVTRITNQVEPLVPKLSVLTKDAVPISVLNIHSALRSTEAQELEKELTFLLVHRLAREREVFVLERQHMREMVFEHELRPEEESPFWTGRYLLDGTLDKNGYDPGQMTISARLVAPHGGRTTDIEAAGPRNNPAALVQSLTTKLTSALKRTPTLLEWRPLEEANQFYEEAKWAYRWRLLQEAQAATEAAWALGNQTKALAEFRIRAYTESFAVSDLKTFQIVIPEFPNAAQLPSAIRALELFCHDAHLGFTNGAFVDSDWFGLGFQGLRQAVAQLDGFYQAAEARSGNDVQLRNLRALARQTAALLHSYVSTNSMGRRPWDFHTLEWEQGGLSFDKPEDSLPMFQQVIEEGYNPTDLPRIVGWSWDDRKRVPALARRFVESLRTAKTPAARLEGLYLAALRTPFDADGRFKEAESELLQALIDHRELVLSSLEHMSLIGRTDRMLRDKHGYVYAARYDAQPFASCRQALRKDYLSRVAVWDTAMFTQLFPDEDIYSPPQARELLPLLDAFEERLESSKFRGRGKLIIARVRSHLQKAAGISEQLVETPKPDRRVAEAAEIPITAEFTPWKLTRTDIDHGRQPYTRAPILRQGKLWFQVRYLLPEGPPMDSQTSYLVVEPSPSASEEIPFPAKLGIPDPFFEISQDCIFASSQKQMYRYRLQKKVWESIPVPLESGAQPLALAGRLYLATRDALLEWHMDTEQTQILVSSRRRPPANDVDSIWEPGAQLYLRSDAKLGVLLGNRVLAFSPSTAKWEQGASLPESADAQWGKRARTRFSSERGVQLLMTGNISGDALVASWHDEPGIATLLQYRDPGLPKNAPRIASAVWDWAPDYPMPLSSICAQEKSIWVLTPRTVSEYGGVPQEPLTFQDNRHATLFKFDAGARTPRVAAIRFEKDGQAIDPFEPQWQQGVFHGEDLAWAGARTRPYLTATSAGLVVSCPAVSGHWVISKQMLELRLRPLSSSQHVQDLKPRTSSSRDDGPKRPQEYSK